MAFGVVYIHYNFLSKKYYIGQTQEPTYQRWKKTARSYATHKNTVALYNALIRYGWEAFESSVVAECETLDELKKTEEFYIKKYNSIAPFGYNLREMSEGRERHSDATKEKMRIAATGRKGAEPWMKYNIIKIDGKNIKQCGNCKKHLSLEENFCKVRKHYASRCHKCTALYYTYKKMPEAQKQQSFDARGKLWKELYDTPEMRQKMRDANRKPILQLDSITKQVIKEWDAAADAVKALGCAGSGISIACNSGRVYKGFLWRFKN